MDQNTVLWEKLKKHIGHSVEIVCYGDEENPQNISLECNDCGEVIIDAELYTLSARDDI